MKLSREMGKWSEWACTCITYLSFTIDACEFMLVNGELSHMGDVLIAF